ncbi:MAG TPA: hypothetical protein VLH56_13830 [Dissulfurispiraceae bacterium]|nr:hypothetical protein [Dissulfurispiraceae bacterium]
MNRVKNHFSTGLIIFALLLIPALASAAPGKSWKKPYTPKNTGEAELFKACAYGNAKHCYKYRDMYIIPQSDSSAKKEKKDKQ